MPGSLNSFPIAEVRSQFCPTILYFQENAGNIAHRLEEIHIMMQRLHCNVFMLSYRGYGASDGYPSQHGITNDAQAALDHLSRRTDIDTSRIVVFGRSLGGAVGAVLTKNNPDKVSALILENTFTSILDMAGVLFCKWVIGGSCSKGPKLLNFLVRSPWSTIDVIAEIKQPILFLSGLQDEMVPPSHMQMLYAKAAARNNQAKFVEFPSGMHMDTWLSGGDHYWRMIQQFLDQHIPENKETESSSNHTVRERVYVRKKGRKRAAMKRTGSQMGELTDGKNLLERQATDSKTNAVPRPSEKRTTESTYAEVAPLEKEGSYESMGEYKQEAEKGPGGEKIAKVEY